jgi:hypothetical protein
LNCGKSQGTWLKETKLVCNLNSALTILAIQRDGAPIEFSKMKRTSLEREHLLMFIKSKKKEAKKYMLQRSLKFLFNTWNQQKNSLWKEKSRYCKNAIIL